MVAEPTYRAKNALFSGVGSSVRQARNRLLCSFRAAGGAAAILVDEHNIRIVLVEL
jgi:hypothetical protein